MSEINAMNTIRIDISGDSHVGKSLVAAIVAEALATAFAGRVTEADVPLDIQVANADGDWPFVLQRLPLRPAMAPNLHRVVIVDGNATFTNDFSNREKLAFTAEQVVRQPISLNASDVREYGYIGPWNGTGNEKIDENARVVIDAE